MSATAVVVMAGLAYLMPNGFTRGVVLGVGTTATVAAFALLTAQATGTAPMIAGATAEQWTASELRKLRPAGWRVMNHFALEDWNIDHVLVGPGGVVAVETKWSHRDWRSRQSRPWLSAAVEQAEGNARSLRLWLKALGVTDVSSVVFCWSANRPERDEPPDQPGRLGSTHLVYGRKAAAAWRRQLIDAASGDAALTADDVARLCDAVDRQIGHRDANSALTESVPPTLARLYWTALAMMLAFFGGVLGNLDTLTTTDSWAAWTGVTVAQATIGLAALRAHWLRRFAVVWLFAIPVAVVLAAADVIIATN